MLRGLLFPHNLTQYFRDRGNSKFILSLSELSVFHIRVMEAPLYLTSIFPRSTECYTWINRPATVLAQHPALALCSYKKITILAFHMAYVFLNFYVTVSISSVTLQCQRRGRICQKTPHASFYPARDFLKAVSWTLAIQIYDNC